MSKKQSKIVLITGGGSGIGRAIAKILLQDSYRVWICGRDEKKLKAATKRLSPLGSIDYFVLDLADCQAIEQFAKNWNKKIYAIVNNAGICRTERLEENFDIWDEVLKTNLDGPYFLTKGLLRYLKDNGRIVNIASQLGQEGRAGYSAYCASKFGLIGLTKCWAKELGPRGITVNCVCPGWVKTEMAEKDLRRIAKEKKVRWQDFYQEICQPLELKRFTEPEEVAELVAFLLSEKASGITGRDWLLNTIWNQQ